MKDSDARQREAPWLPTSPSCARTHAHVLLQRSPTAAPWGANQSKDGGKAPLSAGSWARTPFPRRGTLSLPASVAPPGLCSPGVRALLPCGGLSSILCVL